MDNRLPSPSGQPEPGRLRASDADRDRVAEVLREALAEGRLTPEEHADRIDQVYRARTLGELEPITSDLPSPRPLSPHPRPRAHPPAGRRPADAPPAVAVFSEVKRAGRWRVAPSASTWAVFGAVRLDLTEAVLAEPEVTIRAVSLFGSVNIDVPEGMDVVGGGFAVFGTRNMPGSTAGDPAGEPIPGPGAAPAGAERPVLHVTGFSLFGECVVRRKRRRRSR